MIQLDPKLKRALDSAVESVRAVVTLDSKSAKPLAPEETEASVQSIVERATKKTKIKPRDLVVFPNLQSFSIDADPSFMKEVLSEDSVHSASLNV
ncbi:hypothetical protein [Sphingobium subterraneum]|uniref:Uncharacterized protein n=1 Tax=Sphingobium subterraneum TaxID=627688 RepID=A0A841IXD2_9SPHN|nr:hypothetical protein [Sphingobium subterraneum]MBB6122940.1 hypothetical protein [Sphingobium subterraneum]